MKFVLESKGSMYKALVLYLFVLGVMSLVIWQLSFTWLIPISSFILLVGAIWLWQAEGYPLRDLGLQFSISWRRNISWGFFIGLILPLVLMTIQAVRGWITVVPTSWSAANLAIVVLLAVVKMAFIVALEEVIFRGYFLQRFSFSLGTRLAVLLSSFLWALMHLPNMIRSELSPLLVTIGVLTFSMVGAALGIGFLRGDNTLWFPFGLHYGYNMSYSLTGGLVGVRYHAPTWWVGHPAWAPESGLLGLLLAVAILGVVEWSTRKRIIKLTEDKEANSVVC
jgi:membrane protease YdiL (CAAX protease family)